jgi:hypothetical protein
MLAKRDLSNQFTKNSMNNHQKLISTDYLAQLPKKNQKVK